MYARTYWARTTEEVGTVKDGGEIVTARSNVEWTITYAVSGYGPMYQWSDSSGKPFLPYAVTVIIRNDVRSRVTARGGVLRKDGTPGERSASRDWYTTGGPEWVLDIVADAIAMTQGA
jgi:hypothetical protein